MSPKGDPREHRFSMMMTDAERAKLDVLAEADRRSAAEWIRIAIDTAHAERFGAPKKKPTKK